MKTILLLLTIFSLIDTSNINDFKNHEVKVEKINYTHWIIQWYDWDKMLLIHWTKQSNNQCEKIKCLESKWEHNLLLPWDIINLDLKIYSYKWYNYWVYLYKR